VKQIIEAESQPIRQLEKRKQVEEAKVKLFQDFKSKFSGVDKALGEVGTLNKFREFKVDMGDGANFVSVTMDKDKVQPGNYEIQVDQLAGRTSAISNGFDNPDDPVLGLGYITMNLASGGSAEIYVDQNKSSLRGIAELINAEKDLPIRASVVRDAGEEEGGQWKLIIAGRKDGVENGLEFPEFYFLDGSSDFYIDGDREARNALLQMNGFPIEAASNDLPDFFPGVNLHLKQARPDQPFTIQITEDTQKMAGKVKSLVDEVNKVLEFIVKQNTIDEKSDTRSTFAGDVSLQNIEYKLRNLVHEGYPVGNLDTGDIRLVYLNQIGVEFEKTGLLSFKEEKFQKALEKDLDGVTQAISGPLGFATQINQIFGSLRGAGGVFTNREASMRARIKDIDNQIEIKARGIERRQQSLTDQFARLEGTLSAMQRQGQALSAAMPTGGGGNLVAQLLGG
jgi:flagellar hook-associated protein 2